MFALCRQGGIPAYPMPREATTVQKVALFGSRSCTSRMSVRDRMSRDQPIAIVCGPLSGLTADGVVSAVRTLASMGPHTYIAASEDEPGLRWLHHDDRLDPWCRDLVGTVTPVSWDSAAQTALDLLSEISPAKPLRFVVAGDSLIQLALHSLGDAHALLHRMAAVASLASGRPCDLAWFTPSIERIPLLRSIGTTFVRHPRTIGALRTARRERAGPPPATRTVRNSRAEGRVAWHSSRAVAYGVSQSGTQKKLARWARAQEPRVTVSAAQIVAIRQAFQVAGVVTTPDATLICDVRRYLPKHSRRVTGNFVTGIPLPGHVIDDPARLSVYTRDQLRSGRPLAALAAGIASQSLRRSRPVPARTVPRSPRAHLVFSRVTMPTVLRDIPWSGEPSTRFMPVVAESAGPEHIAVILMDNDGVLHLSMAFHADVFDEDRVRAAVGLAAAHPVELLEAASNAGTAGIDSTTVCAWTRGVPVAMARTRP